jgi:hypothetical protein
MLVMTGGRERTKLEFEALLDAADYKLTRIVPTIAPQSIIEAMPRQRRRAQTLAIRVHRWRQSEQKNESH